MSSGVWGTLVKSENRTDEQLFRGIARNTNVMTGAYPSGA